MNPKMKALKLKKLTDFVAQHAPALRAQYLKDVTPIALAEGVGLADNLMIGSCIYLNHLLCEKLVDNGFNAKLKAGRATFGVNKNQYGVLDFGYETNMDTLSPDGSLFIGEGFKGHCWVEVKNLDAIVDLTLLHTKEHMISDNTHRGIVDNDYLLDATKAVVLTSELVSRDKIVSGSVGYHYASNAAMAAQAFAKLEALKETVQEGI
ncbi:hypothetical protein NTE19_003327 [Vibrio fluvialis]|nr:hypothetical protein [Vibrio fluvialis]